MAEPITVLTPESSEGTRYSGLTKYSRFVVMLNEPNVAVSINHYYADSPRVDVRLVSDRGEKLTATRAGCYVKPKHLPQLIKALQMVEEKLKKSPHLAEKRHSPTRNRRRRRERSASSSSSSDERRSKAKE